MGVYETAIDTILVSFLEDEAENDGKNSECSRPRSAMSHSPLTCPAAASDICVG